MRRRGGRRYRLKISAGGELLVCVQRSLRPQTDECGPPAKGPSVLRGTHSRQSRLVAGQIGFN